MKRLQGLTIGFDFERKLTERGARWARVNSVFRKVINLNLEDDMLVSISAKELLNAPNNLVLDYYPNLDFKELGIEVGVRVRLSLEEINFIEDGIRIDLADIEVWKGQIDKRVIEMNLDRFRDNLDFFTQLLLKEGQNEGVGEINTFLSEIITGKEVDYNFNRVSKRAYSIVTALVEAALVEDRKEICNKSKELLGLGPGLTPAGDDFLVGFYTLLGLIEARSSNKYITPELKEELLAAAEISTTEISKTTLKYILNFGIPEVILRLIESLFIGSDSDIFINTLRLLDRGSTSGTDIATGILLGSKILLISQS